MLKVVVLINNKCYRREIPEKKDHDGYYILPKDHYSAGWVHRVWGIEWDDLDPLTVPTPNELLRFQITGEKLS